MICALNCGKVKKIGKSVVEFFLEFGCLNFDLDLIMFDLNLDLELDFCVHSLQWWLESEEVLECYFMLSYNAAEWYFKIL